MSRRDIILFSVIGVLLIFNLLTFSKISSLEERFHMFDNLQNQIQNVENTVQDVSSQLDVKLTEFSQEQLWIQEKEYTFNDANIEENSIDVVVTWSLKDLHKDERVVFLYREKGKQNWSELKVTKHSGLNYSLEHTFPLKGNYETQVVAISEEGQRGEKLLDLNFEEQLNQRIQTHAFVHQAGDGMFDVNIDIFNTFETEFLQSEDVNDFKIKTANAQLLFNGKVIKEWDLLKEHQHFQSDSLSESLSYNEFLDLKDEVGTKIGLAELHVTVEDGLGLTYETIGTSEK